MKIGITGGTGFIGSHLANTLTSAGIDVVATARGVRPKSAHPCLRFVQAAVDDAGALTDAFAGCNTIVHCAGINREIGDQTYQRVHIDGTNAVIAAARQAGVSKIILLSFLRARPDGPSAYHRSKWAAEQLVRSSGLDYTIIKAGMTYGRGDHMLDHLSHALHTFPLFATVGFRVRPVRPLPIEDLVRVLCAATVDGRLSRQTVAVTGAEEMTLRQAVCRVADVVGKHPVMFRAPIAFHRVLAHICEWTMRVPLVSKAQVRILSESVVEALPFAAPLPADLVPRLRFTREQIRRGLPKPGAFTCRDLRCGTASWLWSCTP